MEELPPQLSVSDSVPTLVQTVTTLPSEQQHRKQSHGPVVVGDLGGLAGGQLQGVVTSGGSLLDSGVRMRARGHLETLGETLSSHPAFCDPKDQQNQPSIGSYATNSLGEATSSSLSTTSTTTYDNSYREVLGGLHNLWSDQIKQIEALTDDHWKNQEFPLARIKKIMRMDDDVKMISTEVPVMFSKILEIFITELTMRAWLHTEESKRRTVQRSDIAMAITKHDMFDFLIDIVPREEIQFKTKSQKEGGEGLQVVPPDLLQSYIQQLILAAAGGGAAGGEEREDVDAATTNAMQQLHLLQQLMQLQQAQQEPPPEQQLGTVVGQEGAAAQTPHSGMGGGSSSRHPHLPGTQQQESATNLAEVGSGVNMQVLQSSVSLPSLTCGLSTNSSSPAPSSMSSTLEQIAKNGGQCQLNSSALHQTPSDPYQARPLVQQIGQPAAQHQQPADAADNTHITTVVIPRPPDSLMTHPRSISSTILEPSSSSPASISSPVTFSRPQEMGQDGLRSQLETLATEQFITQQLPLELAGKFASSMATRIDGEEVSGMEMVEQNMQFQHSSNALAIDSVNPDLAGVIFSTDKQCIVEDVSNT